MRCGKPIQDDSCQGESIKALIKSHCIPQLIDGATSCKRCAMMRLPCTWTQMHDIMAFDWYDLLPYTLNTTENAVKDIPGPSLANAAESNIEDEEELEDEEFDMDELSDSEDED